MVIFEKDIIFDGNHSFVNYLSHFYLFIEDEDPLFSLGKVLPDLLRTFANIKHLKAVNADDVQLHPLYKGIDVHLEADKIFHNSSFFEENTEKVKEALLAQDFKSLTKFKFFYAHILLELLLDRLLLHDRPEVANKFYDHLNMVDEVTIGRFMRYNGWESKTEEFLKFFRSFKNSRYLYGYADNDGIIYALERIGIRVGLHPFAEGDKVMLKGVVTGLEEYLKPNYSIIYQEIEEQINLLNAH